MIATTTSAMAADLGKGFGASGGASLISDYRYRGISLSGGDPAVQGNLDLNHDSGFYVGTWASTIAEDDLYGDVEVDLYGGWSGALAKDTNLSLVATYYAYPRGKGTLGEAEYAEGIATLTHGFGPVEAGFGVAYAPRQVAIGNDDNLYLFADASAPIKGTPLTFKAHVGRSAGALAFRGDYLDWSLGAEGEYGPLTAGIAFVDTDLSAEHDVKRTLVFSIRAAF